jgi:hypothetical protein
MFQKSVRPSGGFSLFKALNARFAFRLHVKLGTTIPRISFGRAICNFPFPMYINRYEPMNLPFSLLREGFRVCHGRARHLFVAFVVRSFNRTLRLISAHTR